MRKIFLLVIALLIISCKGGGGSPDVSTSPGAPTEGTSSDPVLDYNAGTTASSDNDRPQFYISRKDGSGFNSGTVIRAYSDSSCTNLILTQTMNSYSTGLILYISINTVGGYNFSVSITDPYGGGYSSSCSNAKSYTLNAPAAPTGASFWSEASPSANPNPRIILTGTGNKGVEIYLNSSCSGTAYTSSSSYDVLLPPLPNNTYSFYAKTVTPNGIKSSCSSKLLDYQSLANFSLNLSISTNSSTFDYSSIESEDIDGDGNADYVSTKSTVNSTGINFGNGSGSFATFKSLYIPAKATSLKIIDVDGDGRKDILIGDDNRNLSYYHNDGSRNFTGTTLESLGYNAFDKISYIEYVDINGDGIKDIILGAPRNSKIYVKYGLGSGTFQAAIDLMGATAIDAPQIVDINHDGYPDLIDRGTSSKYDIYLNDGSGHFSLNSMVSPSISNGQGFVADVNGDGWPDLVTTNYNELRVRLNNHAGGFGSDIVTTFFYTLNPQNMKIVDFNGDGNKDVVVFDSMHNNIAIAIGNGDGSFNPALLYPVKGSGPFAVLDMNNDGKLDIFTSSLIKQN